MRGRSGLARALVGLGSVLLAAAAVTCGGNPYGQCVTVVTVYYDGDVFRFSTDKEYCEQGCAERIAESTDLIQSCYFEGAVAGPVAPVEVTPE
jgi:hypothetical protein